MVEGRAIAIFRVGNRYRGLRDACPHQGAARSAGIVVGKLDATAPGDYHYDAERCSVKCPWHGYEYDLETGESCTTLTTTV
jgi:3-phenylpropionate/trans-cinnamate dioxygenase ferredoxin subunit